MRRDVRLPTIAIALCSLLFVWGCSDSETSGESSEAPKSTETFTAENWARLARDPDRYEDAQVDFVGRVFKVERDEDAVYLQVWANPDLMDWNTIVVHFDPDFVVAYDDYVHVDGVVVGEFEGENMLGAKISAVQVIAHSLAVVDATALAPKAVRTVRGPVEIDQHGLVVILDRVEFASSEARVYITLKNGTNDTASFYSFSSKATQGTKQFDAEYFTDYPEVQSDLLPGVESSGVIVFKGLDPDLETKIYLEARTDDFSVDFEAYTFSCPAG